MGELRVGGLLSGGGGGGDGRVVATRLLLQGLLAVGWLGPQSEWPDAIDNR